jgi:hypothetical protein
MGCPALVVRLQRPRLARTLGKVLIDAALFEGWKLDAWVTNDPRFAPFLPRPRAPLLSLPALRSSSISFPIQRSAAFRMGRARSDRTCH